MIMSGKMTPDPEMLRMAAARPASNFPDVRSRGGTAAQLLIRGLLAMLFVLSVSACRTADHGAESRAETGIAVAGRSRALQGVAGSEANIPSVLPVRYAQGGALRHVDRWLELLGSLQTRTEKPVLPEMLARRIPEFFHIRGMTRVSTGKSWSRMTAIQQDRLVQAYSRFLAKQFVQHIASVREIPAPGSVENGPGETAWVHAVFEPLPGETEHFFYLCRAGEGGWRIIDFVRARGASAAGPENGYSELHRRRSEFAAILRRGGVQGLLEQLSK